MAEKKLNIVFQGIDNLSPMLKKGELSAQQFANKLKELNKEQGQGGKGKGGPGGFIKDLKSQFGEESELGGMMKMAKGAGAIAAVGMAVKAVKDFAVANLEAKKAYDEGRISLSEMMDKQLDTIPVLGSGIKLVALIHDAWTGAAKAARETNAEIARQTILTTALNNVQKLQFQSSRQIAEQLKTINRAYLQAGAEGYSAAMNAAKNAGDDKLKALNDQKRGQLEKIQEEQNKQGEALFQQWQKDNDLPKYEKALADMNAKMNDKRKEEEAKYAKLESAQIVESVRATKQVEIDQKRMANDHLLDLQQSHNDKLAAIRAEGLRQLGQNLEAEKTLIEQEATSRKAALDREIEEGKRKYAPGIIDWKAYKEEKTQEIDSEAAQKLQRATRDNALTKEQEKFSVAQKLLGSQIAIAEAMGRQDMESRKALATAKAYQEVLQAAAEAQKVLTDPNSSADAKAAARQQMQDSTQLAAWGYQNAVHQPVGEKRLATLQEGFSLTGVAQMSQERDNVQQRALKLSEDSFKVQQQMRDYLKTLVDKVQPAAGEQPIFSKGVGGY